MNFEILIDAYDLIVDLTQNEEQRAFQQSTKNRIIFGKCSRRWY